MESVNPGAIREDEDIQTFIFSINEKLTSAGTGNAELAFGMGCGISIIPIGILLLVLTIFGMRGWVAFGLVILIGVLLATAISTFLASRARASAIRQTYYRDIEPQISHYLQEHMLTRDDFQQAAVLVLSPNAPLLKYLAAADDNAGNREE